MKCILAQMMVTALLAGGLRLVAADAPPTGEVDFGKFTPPGDGKEFVEVNVRNNLITMVARLAEKDEPEVAEVLRGLKAIRVNVVGLNDKNRTEMQERVQKVRADLEAQGWERIVTAQQKEDDVSVYVKTRKDEAVEGVVVTVLDGGGEAVFVNVVGDIKPEKLALLGERFDVEPLKKARIAAKKP